MFISSFSTLFLPLSPLLFFSSLFSLSFHTHPLSLTLNPSPPLPSSTSLFIFLKIYKNHQADDDDAPDENENHANNLVHGFSNAAPISPSTG